MSGKETVQTVSDAKGGKYKKPKFDILLTVYHYISQQRNQLNR
jgi:hypothetical protein